jgi:hypothetical protein
LALADAHGCAGFDHDEHHDGDRACDPAARPEPCAALLQHMISVSFRHTEAMAQPATRNLGRLSEIAQVDVRHGFGYWFDTHRLTDLFPRRAAREEVDGQPSQRGQHLREMLDELGPTFVKFGQLLSTRPDVLPPDIITELRGLQDDVRPFPIADVPVGSVPR